MSITRRQLILLTSTTLVLAACAPSAPKSTINVRDHGAVGDGSTDDSAAITAAAAAVRPGSVLHFPAGRYRFADHNSPTGAAISVAGMSDITIDFAPDAELLMDNVDPATNTGTSHGILIRGPATNVTLRNVRIRWLQPTIRSRGDGVRIVGYPDDRGTAPLGWTGPATPVRGVTVAGCFIEAAPQAGVVMLGVSGITVTDLRVERTRADGLHFNACRDGKVSRHTAVGTGDDGLALVTYFSDTNSFDPAAETFAFSELTDWSNADFTIDDITVSGSRANGVRLAGAQRVSIAGLTVDDVQHGSAVMIDSSTAGHDVAWEYVASREIRVSGLTAQDCETGIHALARPAATVDRRFTDFSIDVADARLRRCTNWSARVESLSEQRVTGVTLGTIAIDATSAAGGNGGVGLANAQDVHLTDITINHSQAVTAFSAVSTGALAVGKLDVMLTQPKASADAAPCAVFENTDGAIETLTMRWPASPPTWTPALLTSAGTCDPASPPLMIDTLTVEPSFLAARVITCP